MYPPAKVPDLRHGERGYCGPPQTQIGEFVMVRLSAMLKKIWQRRRSAKMAKIAQRLEATSMVNCKSNKSGLTIFAATTYLQVQIFSFHGPKCLACVKHPRQMK
jgi:hypothetical protein